MLRIHIYSRHCDLATEKCASMCYNILFLTANPTYCHIQYHICVPISMQFVQNSVYRVPYKSEKWCP